jgi:hypothetical protein
MYVMIDFLPARIRRQGILFLRDRQRTRERRKYYSLAL